MNGTQMSDRAAAAPVHERTQPSWLSYTFLLCQKDLRIELRSGEVLVTSGFFAVVVIILSSLSFYAGAETRRQVASGVIWLAIAFASVLALGRLWQRERDDGALDGVLLSPVPRSALFAGKALGLLAFLFLIEAVVIPLTAVLFSLDLGTFGLGLFVIALAATPGLAAASTLFGAMTARTRARDLVLAIVLFPLLSPTLLAATVATRELLGGSTLHELGDYLKIIGVFDVAFTAGGLGLFPTLLDG